MIRMIGIDHEHASVSVRSVFAFRKSEMTDTMAELKKEFGADGIIILSTCNRMEVWMSGGDPHASLPDALCRIKKVEADRYRRFFTERNDEDAERHLFYLACGLKSAIVAEDQILTQVREALAFSRANYFTDSVLEVLFQKAISAAKKVKTDVRFTRADSTAIDQAIRILRKQGFDPAGKKCMVIGNGEYGRLVANTLRECGADVTVTVRQYHSGMVLLPEGCRQIHYGEKMNYFPDCSLVASATASPNYTLFYDQVVQVHVNHPMYLLDFAVPPDMDPRIGDLPGYTLYNVDSFRTAESPENREAYEKTREILEDVLTEFQTWLNYRDLVPDIGYIKKEAACDTARRLTKIMRKLPLKQEETIELTDHIEDASGKVISKMLYLLRDSLDENTFRKCVSVLENAYLAENRS